MAAMTLRPQNGGRNRREASCYYIKLRCGLRKCGTVPAFYFSSTPPMSLPHSIPWNLGLYVNGKLTCSASLIDPSWAVTSKTCFRSLNLGQERVDVVGGSYANILVSPSLQRGVWGPNEVSRRVDYESDLEQTDVILLHFESRMPDSRYIVPLCLPDRDVDWRDCAVSLKEDEYLSVGTLFSVNRRCPNDSVCITYHNYDHCFNELSGALACRQEVARHAQWTLAAIWDYSDYPCKVPTRHKRVTPLVAKKIREEMEEPFEPVATPACDGVLCRPGICIGNKSICDGILECPDLQDESETCDLTRLCTIHNCTCECPAGLIACPDGICIRESQLCDSYRDCPGGEDETNCSCVKMNESHPFHICDGKIDCLDESDEDNCGCPKTEFACFKSKNSCLPMDQLCDKVKDCDGGEDEGNCLALSPALFVEENVFKRPVHSSHGYLLVRYEGIWHTFPHDKWENRISDLICKKLGFENAVADTSFKDLNLSDLRSLPEVHKINVKNIINFVKSGDLSHVRVVYISCTRI